MAAVGRLLTVTIVPTDLLLLSVKQSLNRPQQRRPDGLQTARCRIMASLTPVPEKTMLKPNALQVRLKFLRDVCRQFMDKGLPPALI